MRLPCFTIEKQGQGTNEQMRAGRFVRQIEGYRAFLPVPLPPDPPLALDGGTTRTSRSSSHPNSHHLHEAIRPVKTLRVSFNECIYTPLITLCMFLGQVIDPDHSCLRPREPGHDVPDGLTAALPDDIIGDPVRSETDDNHARPVFNPRHPRRSMPRARAVSIR